jgi:hypothetical protein
MRALVLSILFVATVASAQTPNGGIGIQIGSTPKGIEIMMVVPGGAAENAGLHAGEVIVAVNDIPTSNFDLNTVTAMIRGSQGSSVRLDIISPDGKRRTVPITRAALPPLPTTQAPDTPTADAQGPIKFVTWMEPRERSFTVEVPEGWRLNGGVNWTGPIDAQPFVQVQSPDGKVQIFVGDPELLPRTVPNPFLAATGAVEGRVVPSPSGGRMLMQRFLTGREYAREQTNWRLCPNPRWVAESNLDDLSRSVTDTVQPQARAWGATARASAGEASFQCDNKQGYVFAVTVLGSSATGPIQVWGIYKVAGFLSSDPMQSMKARYIMEHMLATAKLDPRWEQAYESKIRGVTGTVISMQNAATQVQLRATQSAANDLSRLNHPNQGVNVRPGSTRSGGVNPTLQTKDVCDAIGRCKNVSNDSDNIWMDHSGNVRPGPDSGGPPDNSGVWSPTYTR